MYAVRTSGQGEVSCALSSALWVVESSRFATKEQASLRNAQAASRNLGSTVPRLGTFQSLAIGKLVQTSTFKVCRSPKFVAACFSRTLPQVTGLWVYALDLVILTRSSSVGQLCVLEDAISCPDSHIN